jgi:hypothetical protein
MNRYLKILFILLIISFLALYLSRYNTSYTENQKVLTDTAIEQFEKDVASGKEIKASNYLEEEKDYNNKASSFGLKTSNIIEESFNKLLKVIMKALNSFEND